jgi:hypothetical protein
VGGVPGHASGYFNPALPSDYVFKAHKGERVEITPAADTPARNAGLYFGPGSIVVQAGPGTDPNALAAMIDPAMARVIRAGGATKRAIQDVQQGRT